MGNDAESVIRRFYELSTAGDPACWDLWAEDAMSRPPPDFPESDETLGVAQIRRWFAGWMSVFGENWWEGLTLKSVTELPDGRLLVDVAFDLAGKRSGAPFHQNAAVIYTVEEGKIVEADHFMDRSTAREAAAR